jgi:hypothetical protein
MGVYDIVTPDNLTKELDWRGGRNFGAILPPNVLFFWTGHGEDSDDGITIDLTGQFVKQLDEDGWLLQPSNIEIRIEFQSVKLKFPGASITQAVLGDDGGEDESDAKLDELRQFFERLLNKQGIKQVGKQVGMVSRLEMPVALNRMLENNNSTSPPRNIPYGAKGVISSFLTGKKGSLASQTNKLQQNLGTAMAPRPRKRKTRRVKNHNY